MTEEAEAIEAAAAPEAGSAPTAAEPTNEPADLRAEMGAVWDSLSGADDAADDGAEETPEVLSAPDEEDTEEADQPADVTPEPETPAIEAPQSWSAPMKEAFGALAPDMREYIARRESEAHAKITEQGEQLARLQPFDQIATRHQDVLKHHGLAPAQAFDSLLQVERMLQTDPVGTVQRLAEAYGVSLGQGQQADARGNNDPQLSRLQSELAETKRQLAEFRNETTQERQAREARDMQETQSRISEWAKSKPHFEAVRATMARLINAGEAAGLDDAYGKAIRLNDDIQRQEAEAAAKAKADEEAKAAAERARKAKAAGRINKGRAGTPAAEPSNLRDTLAEAYERAVSR